MKLVSTVLICCLSVFLCCKAQVASRLRTSQHPGLRSSFDTTSRHESNNRSERENIFLGLGSIFSSKSSYHFRKQRNRKSFVTRLAAQIQRILLSINCRRAKRYLTTTQRCSTIQATPFKHMRFYLAAPGQNTLYSVVLPDGKLKYATNHHAVAVVDPFPNVGFGHLTFIFYVDKISKILCDKKKGLSIGPLFCLTLARRAKCRNTYRSQHRPDEVVQKCEVNFLPLVYNMHQNSKDRSQKLQCHSDVAGFGKCLRFVEEAPAKSCEILQNNQGCHLQKKSSKHKPTQLLCRSYSTCDRSALIFGEWNNLTFHPEREKNLMSTYKMLTKNGYQRNKIQLFHGGNTAAKVKKLFRNGFNAMNKLLLRRHITDLCNIDLCVDTFTIYMNGPALADGSILLQDLNQNGVADESEVYRVREFFDDISNCVANHVVVFADQSYSGMLKTELRQLLRTDIGSWNHVVLLTSGNEYDYSWYRGATENWSSLPSKRSISWAFQNLGSLNSSPTLTSRRHAEDYTLYGASLPRHQNNDDINWNEIMSQHMGCQKLPLSKWML